MHFCASLLRSSNGGGLVVWCVIGLCAGLYLFFRGFRLLQRRRLILDTPFSKIRSASLGMVEVSGLAVGPYTMVAPITAKPCYYYRTVVWEWKQQGKNKQWVKVAGECTHVPFFLDDNTGRVLVDPRQAELDLHQDFHQEFSDSFFTTKEPAPDNVRGFLARHGIVTDNKIKVEEYCIKPKNALFILGTLAENPGLEVTPKPIRDEDNSDAPSGLREFSLSIGENLLSTVFASGDRRENIDERFFAMTMDDPAKRVVRLSPESVPGKSADMSQQQKITAALMKAGITNPAAWAAAGLNDTAVAVSENPVANGGITTSGVSDGSAAKTHAFDCRPPVVLMKGTNNKAFMISWRSQRDVARSLGWKCALMIWGGPALSLVSLYLLLGILHL